MSRNGRAQAQKYVGPKKEMRKHKPDARVQRTRNLLGRALIE